MKYMLGCNYWDSEHGTDMWAKFDPEVLEKDMACMEEWGVEYLRVFPNWRDFQPVKTLYAWRGKFGEYVVGNDDTPYDSCPLGVDENQIKNFRTFASIAKKHGIKLVVAVVTGWMSGRLFAPPALDGKNHITDSESLMWQRKFIKGFVEGVKGCDNIIAWELGNESNCLGNASSRADAYNWTAMVTDTIRAADGTRPVYSGMHALDADETGTWVIRDQGEITDMLTTHPYPSPTIGGDAEPYTNYRTTIAPTAQTEFYAGISGKPAMIEEQGTFSNMLGNREMSAKFMRINCLSGFANGSKGYMWWCSHEHSHLKTPPYSWSMIERELGLVFRDRSPKPVAEMMKKMHDALSALPIEELPEKKIDAVCVLSREINRWQVAASSFILGKQAGLTVTFRNVETELPDAPLYLLPCIRGWQVTYRRTLDTLLEKVEGGASLYVSFDTGHMTNFEETVGMRSHGMLNCTGVQTAKFSFGDIPYTGTKEVLLEKLTADVLAVNEKGNPILTVQSFGKGKIYFLGFPLEQMVWNKPQGFDPEVSAPYYMIYRLFGGSVTEDHIVTCDDPSFGLTENYGKDGRIYGSVMNYTDKKRCPLLKVKNGYRLFTLYGNTEEIDGCDGCIYEIKKA